jgi:hypothetical protein
MKSVSSASRSMRLWSAGLLQQTTWGACVSDARCRAQPIQHPVLACFAVVTRQHHASQPSYRRASSIRIVGSRSPECANAAAGDKNDHLMSDACSHEPIPKRNQPVLDLSLPDSRPHNLVPTKGLLYGEARSWASNSLPKMQSSTPGNSSDVVATPLWQAAFNSRSCNVNGRAVSVVSPGLSFRPSREPPVR